VRGENNSLPGCVGVKYLQRSSSRPLGVILSIKSRGTQVRFPPPLKTQPEHLVAAPQTMALYWLEAPVLVRWSYGHHKYPFWSIVFTNVVKKERTEYRCGSSQTTVSHCSLAVLWDVWRSPTVGFLKSILKCLRRVRTTSRSLSASLGSRVRVAVVVITSYEKWTLRTLFPARVYRNWPSQRYNKVPQV
jgi:hypothetical protein